MKKLNLLFTALLLMCCVGTAKAVEVTIDGIKYDVITKAKQATVISGGNYSGDIVIPSEITYNNVTCSVTSIGNYAFEWCSRLTSITIPNSITSIGEFAFYQCSGLTSITIPNSVTSIGESAFDDCTGLTSITIPNSVTSIEDNAFGDCYGLESIVVDPGNTKYDSRENCNAIIETESNTLITGCKNTIIPNSVTSIGNQAFYGCSGLTSITIPNSVTSIGQIAFSSCDGLKEVHINDIAAWCSIDFGSWVANPLCYAHNLYLNNELVTELIIPNSITSIKNYAFWGCNGLTSITIPNSVTSIGNSAFSSCKGLTSITIPNSVTSIGKWAFQYCTKLTNATIGDNVTYIEEGAFGFTGLKSITIPNSVKTIGIWAFEDCYNLTSITIPNSVTSIGECAFIRCSELTDVYCLATNVPTTESDAFKESYPENMTLHVPAEAINSYKTTAPWNSFGNIVAPKCAAPVFEYYNGKLSFECETEGAEFVTEVTSNDFNKFYDSEINFSATYNISVYATAAGYDNSETVNATLCWIECDCSANDNTTDVINVPAKAVFVTSNNGTINISCSLEGEVVELYTIDAMYIGSTTIENGNATIQSGLSKGDIAIIKIAEKSIKVILN